MWEGRAGRGEPARAPLPSRQRTSAPSFLPSFPRRHRSRSGSPSHPENQCQDPSRKRLSPLLCSLLDAQRFLVLLSGTPEIHWVSLLIAFAIFQEIAGFVTARVCGVEGPALPFFSAAPSLMFKKLSVDSRGVIFFFSLFCPSAYEVNFSMCCSNSSVRKITGS